MTTYTAKFSNGTEFSQNSKRDFSHAWRVEWDGKFSGGFSNDAVNAEKAMNAWIARLRKNGCAISFKEVVAL